MHIASALPPVPTMACRLQGPISSPYRRVPDMGREVNNVYDSDLTLPPALMVSAHDSIAGKAC